MTTCTLSLSVYHDACILPREKQYEITGLQMTEVDDLLKDSYLCPSQQILWG